MHVFVTPGGNVHMLDYTALFGQMLDQKHLEMDY